MASNKRLPPAEEIENAPYTLKTLSAPVLRGGLLKAFSRFTGTSIGASVISSLQRKSGIPQVTTDISIPERPSFKPVSLFDPEPPSKDDLSIMDTPAAEYVRKILSHVPKATENNEKAPCVQDYVNAYVSGEVTPAQVTTRIVAAIRNDPNLHFFISFNEDDVLKQGRESAERYAQGKPLSILDGVPFCAKDSFHAIGHNTTRGTKYLKETVDDNHPEAPSIRTMKELGCIFLGKTTMHEIGLGVTGLNLIHGTPANPWNRDHFPGGSSSGGAAVVASGLCPLSIGTDGGGSVRIPASFCGIFGLKMTHDREIEQCQSLSDYTVCCVGPLTNCVADAMLLYSVLAKKPTNASSKSIPPLSLPHLRFSEKPLSGYKLGIYWEWFNDAEEEIKICCRSALDHLKNLGCQIVEVCIPELEFLRVAHTITIATEMRQAVNLYFTDPKTKSEMNLDVQTSLLVASFFKSYEYVQAQCIRTRMGVHFKRVFNQVDCIITPTTPMTAPRIHPLARTSGEHNLTLTSQIMRFVVGANLIGFPATSIPVGFDSNGLPIGLQFMGRHWQESLLLKMCYHLEKTLSQMPSHQKRPALFYNPLLE